MLPYVYIILHFSTSTCDKIIFHVSPYQTKLSLMCSVDHSVSFSLPDCKAFLDLEACCQPFFFFFNNLIFTGFCIHLHFNCYPFPSLPSPNPLSHPSSPCFYEGTSPHTHAPKHSHLTVLAFPYTGASSLHRTKGIPSHWCQIRTSFATYAAGAMGPLWKSVWWFLRKLVRGSCNTSHGYISRRCSNW